ncbi:MAG: Stealth CR1 domain-containing protein [bacterium]|nr:Stealth CR1 domain-containing protein [bacterium]
MSENLKIDIVYLWVDGSDSEFIKEKKDWQEKLGIPHNDDNADARFVDNQELRYSLRSVEINAPWVNKIYIVTNGQIPDWLDLSKTDKIKIINHKAIIPAKYLPCFNSRVIETFVTNIPDLSEYFLLSNDDCFVNRPVQPDFFIDDSGLPIPRLFHYDYTDEVLEKSLYKKSVLHSINLIKEKYGKTLMYVPHHNMDLYSKKIFNKCLEEFKEEFEKLRNQKFRELSIQRVIFLLYQIANHESNIVCEYEDTFDGIHADSLYADIKEISKLQRQILSKTPYLLCINDEPDVSSQYRNQLPYLLQIMYPKKQDWEKNSQPLCEKKLQEYQKICITVSRKLFWKRILENIFSIKNKIVDRQKYKVVTILWKKIQFKSKRKEH